jgi:predicted  nucleic acid-binding Zn-ribbon protein
MTTQKIKDSYSDDVRLALLEQSINNINNTLVRFEKRFDQIDDKFERINADIRDMRSHFDRLLGGIYLIFGSSVIALLFKFIHIPIGA